MDTRMTAKPAAPQHHFDQCFRDSDHHSCAVWEIERLRGLLTRTRVEKNLEIGDLRDRLRSADAWRDIIRRQFDEMVERAAVAEKDAERWRVTKVIGAPEFCGHASDAPKGRGWYHNDIARRLD
jgi:hypothetical protein